MSLAVLVLLLSFAIPILGIGLAGYKEWLKFRAKQQELGASTQDVEETVEALRERLEHVEQERDALKQRVQNLERLFCGWIRCRDTVGEVAKWRPNEAL